MLNFASNFIMGLLEQALRQKKQKFRSQYDKPDHARVRGRSYPQHGKRECARRVQQMAAAGRTADA